MGIDDEEGDKQGSYQYTGFFLAWGDYEIGITAELGTRVYLRNNMGLGWIISSNDASAMIVVCPCCLSTTF